MEFEKITLSYNKNITRKSTLEHRYKVTDIFFYYHPEASEMESLSFMCGGVSPGWKYSYDTHWFLSMAVEHGQDIKISEYDEEYEYEFELHLASLVAKLNCTNEKQEDVDLHWTMKELKENSDISSTDCYVAILDGDEDARDPCGDDVSGGIYRISNFSFLNHPGQYLPFMCGGANVNWFSTSHSHAAYAYLLDNNRNLGSSGT